MKHEEMAPKFTDLSTATNMEKARRFLQALASASGSYFHDDGYPRFDKLDQDAVATIAVLAQVEAETLAKIRTKIRALKAGPDDGDAEFISAYNCALTDAEVEVNEFSGSLSDCYKANNLPTPTKSVVPEGMVMEQKFDVAFEALRKIEEMTFPEGRVYEIAHKTLCDIDAMIQAAPTANEKLTPAKLAVDTDVSVSGGLIDGWRPGEEK